MIQRDSAEQPKIENFRVWRRPIQSLPTRIGFFVLATTLCTSLAVTGIAVRLIDSFLRQTIEESFPAILERTAADLEFWYENRERDLQTFAESEVLERQLPELSDSTDSATRRFALAEVGHAFKRLLADAPEISSVFLLDHNGDSLFWQGPQIELSADMRKEIRRSGFSRAGYSRGRYFQVASIQLDPVHEPSELDSNTGPTLHLVMGLEQLAPILKLHGGGFSAQISIVSEDLRYLASSSAGQRPETYALPLATSDAPSRAADSTDAEGKRLISSSMALTRLPELGWMLVIEEEYDLAFARVVAATQQVLGINLAIVAIFALVAYRIAVAMVRPIEVLSEAAIRISRGEKNVQIPESISRDEVGLLTSAFFEMTNRLHTNAQELEAAHRNVEEVNAMLRSRNDELYSANEVLAQLSITDGLTQLHNHRFFQDTIVKEARRADRTKEPLALVLIDIDHFKSWNDRLGHAGGDEILRRIAALMSDLLRSTDLLARYGGEEFALVAPGTSLEGALQLAEKMRISIGETCFFLDPPSEHQRVTVSMGVALYRGDRKRLFNDADQALYRAKAAGRDCVVAFEDPDSPDDAIA